jgi:hypothetical protein
MEAIITKPFFDVGGRKYICLRISEKVIQVKVPFRYNRVMCRVNGLRPVQDLGTGETVTVVIENRRWDGDVFPVLKEISCSDKYVE